MRFGRRSTSAGSRRGIIIHEVSIRIAVYADPPRRLGGVNLFRRSKPVGVAVSLDLPLIPVNLEMMELTEQDPIRHHGLAVLASPSLDMVSFRPRRGSVTNPVAMFVRESAPTEHCPECYPLLSSEESLLSTHIQRVAIVIEAGFVDRSSAGQSVDGFWRHGVGVPFDPANVVPAFLEMLHIRLGVARRFVDGRRDNRRIGLGAVGTARRLLSGGAARDNDKRGRRSGEHVARVGHCTHLNEVNQFIGQQLVGLAWIILDAARNLRVRCRRPVEFRGRNSVGDGFDLHSAFRIQGDVHLHHAVGTDKDAGAAASTSLGFSEGDTAAVEPRAHLPCQFQHPVRRLVPPLRHQFGGGSGEEVDGHTLGRSAQATADRGRQRRGQLVDA